MRGVLGALVLLLAAAVAIPLAYWRRVPPWSLDDVVRGVLDGVADLKRRITHPSTRRR